MIIAWLLLWSLAAPAQAESRTVFNGRPAIRVSEGGVERVVADVPRADADNYRCVISQIGEDLYWASRDNVRLVAVESGAYITYVAANGSGYVRVLKPSSKAVASAAGGAEAKYDYVEHLLLGLRSVTYYGSAR